MLGECLNRILIRQHKDYTLGHNCRNTIAGTQSQLSTHSQVHTHKDTLTRTHSQGHTHRLRMLVDIWDLRGLLCLIVCQLLSQFVCPT